ncbi:MAG: ACP S-malonyltransferase [Acidobacteriota bacterium]|jgi:[acyl-carrier-protein] S-malonyltransferase
MTESTTPRYAFVFPGQGSQKVGMGRDWADAFPASREVFDEADRILGFSLSRLCWEGPEDELTLTANLQPALLTTSVAILRAVETTPARPVAVAGHSLGEYSALVAAGALELADALRLVRRRGELMQEAVPVGVGAMAAILALDDETVEGVVEEVAGDDVLAVANKNAPGQVVLAGHVAAVERAVELAKERGGKARMVPVSAPFHCPLMEPARRGLEPLLRETRFRDPAVPVVTNVDAAPVETGEAAREALIRQVDGAVRWVESVEWMVDRAGVGAFVEVGPGNVLSGMIRRIRQEPERITLKDPSGLAALAG